jgi:hypothetical protein
MRLALILAVLAVPFTASAQQRIFPDATWSHKTPAEAGLDAAGVKSAVDYAIAGEVKNPRDLVMNHYATFGREPFGYPVGPIKDRADPTGLIVYKGSVVAEWGEPLRVDMTHSVTKSMLSSVVGVAVDRGMIHDVHDRVADYMAPIVPYHPIPLGDKSDRLNSSSGDFIDLFATPHNRTITWDDMLRQTSDWEGILWGKPDWADRPDPDSSTWLTRQRAPSGTTWKYNDTRVNALALATLNVWRRPLPQVLKETIMDPIGASNTWRWYGYENSWIVLDGLAVQAVTGGGHFGGGLYINAYDMARFGYLTLNRGRWKDRQLLSDKWISMALTPTVPNPGYGFANYFLNTDKKMLPSAPASAYAHIGNGTNMIYVDPEHDIVVVMRWIDSTKADGVVQRLLAALPKG